MASNDAPTDTHHFHLLDLIFNAMVLLVGLHELEIVSSVERLKTDLRVRHDPSCLSVAMVLVAMDYNIHVYCEVSVWLFQFEEISCILIVRVKL